MIEDLKNRIINLLQSSGDDSMVGALGEATQLNKSSKPSQSYPVGLGDRPELQDLLAARTVEIASYKYPPLRPVVPAIPDPPREAPDSDILNLGIGIRLELESILNDSVTNIRIGFGATAFIEQIPLTLETEALTLAIGTGVYIEQTWQNIPVAPLELSIGLGAFIDIADTIQDDEAAIGIGLGLVLGEREETELLGIGLGADIEPTYLTTVDSPVALGIGLSADIEESFVVVTDDPVYIGLGASVVTLQSKNNTNITVNSTLVRPGYPTVIKGLDLTESSPDFSDVRVTQDGIDIPFYIEPYYNRNNKTIVIKSNLAVGANSILIEFGSNYNLNLSTPSAITSKLATNVAYWLDSRDFTDSVTNEAIEYWYTKPGIVGGFAYQNTIGTQPTVQINQFGNIPGLRFLTNRSMIGDQTGIYPNSRATVIAVARIYNATNTDYVVFTSVNATDNPWRTNINGNWQLKEFRSQLGSITGAPTSGINIWSISTSPADNFYRCRINGTNRLQTTAQTFTSHTLFRLGRNAGTSAYLNGSIGALIVLNDGLNVEDNLNIERYLAQTFSTEFVETLPTYTIGSNQVVYY
ncbi:MAG: hypothetical protein LRZ84_14485 [Desertifilum sp.]|nr:hypothetical protein [Desertifilum sp.]